MPLPGRNISFVDLNTTELMAQIGNKDKQMTCQTIGHVLGKSI